MNGEPAHGGWRHWAGFIGSGTAAFVVDVSVLRLLSVSAGLPVSLARILSISTAMIVGWLGHRTFTFRVRTPPRLAEFARYLGVAWSAAALNYLIFEAIVLLRPQTLPGLAVAIASGGAMVASYLGLRFGAFRTPPQRP